MQEDNDTDVEAENLERNMPTDANEVQTTNVGGDSAAGNDGEAGAGDAS